MLLGAWTDTILGTAAVGIGAVPGVGAGVATGVGTGAGVGAGGDVGAGSGEVEGPDSGMDAAVPGLDGGGVQPAASITNNIERIMIVFISLSMPTVQNMSTGIISYHFTAAQTVIDAIAWGKYKRLLGPFIGIFNWPYFTIHLKVQAINQTIEKLSGAE